MSRLCFINGRMIGAAQPDRLEVEDGRIVGALSGAADRIIDLGGGMLLPGFIDTQVNGGGDRLFNDSPTVETIRHIGETHRRFGTTSFLPTLISDDLAQVDKAMRAVEQAMAQGVAGVVGIHLEGPFLSPARKGTHDAGWFRTLDDAAIDLLTSLRGGRTLVTLAPEKCSDADIGRLVQAGVIVAAGHSDADYARAQAAFAAGVTGVTHLYNAMSPLHHRAPGLVGAVLEDRHVYAGIVVDGRHVHPAALRIAAHARPRDRFMLVTDAMPSVGSATKSFRLQGKTITVRDGVCVEADGTLAGSDLDMASALRNAMAMMQLTLEEASVMASAAPAAFLRLADRGRLIPGQRADLVWLGSDLTLRAVVQAGIVHDAG